MIERLLQILDDGGTVAWALFVVSFAIWWVVYARYWGLRSSRTSLREASSRGVTRALFRSRLDEELRAWRGVLRTLVAVAPMLGLLGTVGGMIETFSTLHMSGLSHADASVAGGISTALVTTQLGLLVGVPGLIAALWLERIESRCRAAVMAEATT